jgi:hypothetical protein
MSGTAILPPIPTYKMVSANEAKYVVSFAASDPQTKSDAAYFTSIAKTLTTPDALLKNYRALGIVLNSFGISSHINDTALLRQVMKQNPNAKTSTAYQINNPALTRFATAMGQFAKPPFASARNVAAMLNANATNNFETNQDELAPGIANALYFGRSIGAVSSIYQLMSDTKLLQVAEIATKQPKSFGSLDFTTQEKLLSAAINVKDFQKPAFVKQFITKYLAINQAENTTPTDSTGAISILSSSGSANNMLSTLMPSNSASNSANSVLPLFSTNFAASNNASILSVLA